MKELAVFIFLFLIFFFPLSLTSAHLWRLMMRHKTEVQRDWSERFVLYPFAFKYLTQWFTLPPFHFITLHWHSLLYRDYGWLQLLNQVDYSRLWMPALYKLELISMPLYTLTELFLNICKVILAICPIQPLRQLLSRALEQTLGCLMPLHHSQHKKMESLGKEQMLRFSVLLANYFCFLAAITSTNFSFSTLYK